MSNSQIEVQGHCASGFEAVRDAFIDNFKEYVHVMSSTKGIVSLIAHQLVERGLLDLDAPVAKYWKGFAQAGKEELPVRYLLTHQAGLPAPDQMLPPGATSDWDLMVKTLESQTPIWKPGEKFGYHANAFGFLVGQVIRGATGKTVGQLIKEQIADPLGVDFTWLWTGI
jgi:CubicO group peptidase (beta-lactamase class C family)